MYSADPAATRSPAARCLHSISKRVLRLVDLHFKAVDHVGGAERRFERQSGYLAVIPGTLYGFCSALTRRGKASISNPAATTSFI
jgi:hypothetical protein